MRYQITSLAETITTTLITWMIFHTCVVFHVLSDDSCGKCLPHWLHEWFFTFFYSCVGFYVFSDYSPGWNSYYTDYMNDFYSCVGCHMCYQTTPMPETLTTLITWIIFHFFFLLWLVICIFWLLLWLELLPHWLHVWFFTPVWVVKCLISTLL